MLQFESLSPPLVVRITRQADPMSVGFKADYELQMMLVETGGSTHCVTDPANLEYTSTHHNWHDQARALDQGSWYTLALDYIFPAPGNWDVEVHWEFALTVEDANSGQVILGPVLLEQTGGPPI